MIFLSVGSENFQFNRLIKIIDEEANNSLINKKIFAQVGNSTYKPVNFSYMDFLGHEKVNEFIQKSEIIITHAGVGTIINCIKNNRIPVVFPRLKKYKEHIDNHQLELTKRLEKEKMILAAYDGDDLIDKIENYYELANYIQISKKYSINKDILITNLFALKKLCFPE